MIIQLDDGIRLISGAMMNYNDPTLSEVTIEDIAFALGNVCRFAGHIPFYSVAQHALNVSRILPDEDAYDGLMHDTAEAFTNDIPTPLKTAVPAFKDLEVRIETAMSKRFGFRYPLSPAVKYADLQMLKVEKELLKRDSSHWAILDGVELPELDLVDLSATSPKRAMDEFLGAYWELTVDAL